MSTCRDRAAASLVDPDLFVVPSRAPRRVVSACIPLGDQSLAALRCLIARVGLVPASNLLDTPRTSLACAAAGASLRRASRMLLEQRLDALTTKDGAR